MKSLELIKRLDYVLNQGNEALALKDRGNFRYYVPTAYWSSFRAAGLSFIESIYGKESTYYNLFAKDVDESYTDNIESGIRILNTIKHAIENDWLISYRGLIAAELFSNFLEMAAHLIAEGYKDAAAVIIGSTLEEHLRQVCDTHGVDLTVLKGTDQVAKKADLLNADLKKANIYGALEQKQVTTWLALRNSAAHGKYNEYTKEQVDFMYQGVLNFITTIK
jgi:hypothetical protein